MHIVIVTLVTVQLMIAYINCLMITNTVPTKIIYTSFVIFSFKIKPTFYDFFFYRIFYEDLRKVIYVPMKALYNKIVPHTEIEYVIVLPNIEISNSIIFASLVRSPLFTVWAIIIILVSIVRKILQRFTVTPLGKQRSYNDLFFDSLGRAFGTTIIETIDVRSERVLLVALSLVTVLAGIFCSGMLIEKFYTKRYTQSVQTVDEFKSSSGYVLTIPDTLDEPIKDWFRERYKHLCTFFLN